LRHVRLHARRSPSRAVRPTCRLRGHLRGPLLLLGRGVANPPGKKEGLVGRAARSQGIPNPRTLAAAAVAEQERERDGENGEGAEVGVQSGPGQLSRQSWCGWLRWAEMHGARRAGQGHVSPPGEPSDS
jgi:hypothetical protein